MNPTMTEVQVRHPLEADLASTRRKRISKQHWVIFDMKLKLYRAIKQHLSSSKSIISSLLIYQLEALIGVLLFYLEQVS